MADWGLSSGRMLRGRRLVWLVLAALLVLLSWQRILASRAGLTIRNLSAGHVPLMFVGPPPGAAAPGVLVAHGFSGSKQLMLGYAQALAHAGYAALVWDFDGHGANSQPLGEDSLQANIEAAYQVLLAQPGVDAGRMALLGHSMGSGAVMTAGIAHPDRYAAVVAISPTQADVSPTLPRNLLLQAGSLEGRFVANAERLLAAAGGEQSDRASGLARGLIVIPWAEHISILFRPESQRAAVRWLDESFGRQSARIYTDRRVLWYVVHLAGWLLALAAVRPLLNGWLPGSERARGKVRGWVGMAAGPVVATAVLALASRVAPVAGLGGIQVGGALAVWFGLAGLVWLGSTGRWRGRAGASAGAGNSGWLRPLAAGVGMFLFLTLAFGVMAQVVWLQWWLIPLRLARWPLLALAVLPWFLAAGQAQVGAGVGRRALWWLGQSLVLVVGLALVVFLVPGMFFVFLLLPLAPLLIGILAIAGAVFDSPWAYGVGSALFFGWVLAAVFPLAG